MAIEVKADGHKVVTVTSGDRESTASWSGLLRELKARGMNEPRLVVGDGNLGLWSALRNVFPGAEEQRCWNHRMVNLLTRVPKQRQGEASERHRIIPNEQNIGEGKPDRNADAEQMSGAGGERGITWAPPACRRGDDLQA